MKIINQHLGLPVICLDTSERAGDVLRFITDQVSGHIVAVAVSREWYQEPGAVAFSDCTAFGQNVVLVSRIAALKPLSEMQDVQVHLQASNDARQRTAITESGRLLGAVTDEAFDEATGEVTGYRLDVMAESGTGRTLYISHEPFVTSSGSVAILRDDVLTTAVPTLDRLINPAPETPAQQPDAPGAWAGAESLDYGASPEDAGDTETSEEQPASTLEAEALEAEALDAAAMEGPAVEIPAEVPIDEDAFADTAPLDETFSDEAAVAGVIDPEIVDLSEEQMADEETVGGEASSMTPLRDALHAQERVMMALVIGKTAGATVQDEGGATLVTEGQKITPDVAESARAANKLYDVWMSAQG